MLLKLEKGKKGKRKRKGSSERDGNGKFLSVDGGASVNDTLMQIQADILNKGIHRPANIETTAYGAALAAAVGRNWLSVDDILGDRKLYVEDESKLFVEEKIGPEKKREGQKTEEEENI